jgi:hypothetical protein
MHTFILEETPEIKQTNLHVDFYTVSLLTLLQHFHGQ